MFSSLTLGGHRKRRVVSRRTSQVAHTLARACGHVGSGAAYLLQTVAKLEEFGIRDRNLWRLQQLVADEILRLATPRLR